MFLKIQSLVDNLFQDSATYRNIMNSNDRALISNEGMLIIHARPKRNLCLY